MAEVKIKEENIELILNKDEFRNLGSALIFAENRLKELAGELSNDEKREDLRFFCRVLREKINEHLPFTDEIKDIQKFLTN